MSRKRKCIVILLFIVIVSILFILYNRSQFFFGTLYHCTYSVYQLHSKSFKNHKNLIVPQCPVRFLTVQSGGQLGNIIWEYISVLAFQKVYRFNGSIYFAPKMIEDLQGLFHRVYSSNNSEIFRCINEHHINYHIQTIGLMEKPTTWFAGDNLAVVLDVFSCRYDDLAAYGLENMRQKLRFRQIWIRKATHELKNIKASFGFNETDIVTFVGVHYRGGDYNEALMQSYPKEFVGPPSFLYYRNAMKYFEDITKNPIFVFVTIDYDWAEENLRYLQSFKIFVHQPVGVVEDLVILSLCNHTIINYGTYGASAALFANGTTFVYDLKLPNDGRGYTLANNMAKVTPNWFLCDNSSPCKT